MAVFVNSAPPLIRPRFAGLVEFCDLIDEPLHPHERRISRAYFGTAREIAAILPAATRRRRLRRRSPCTIC